MVGGELLLLCLHEDHMSLHGFEKRAVLLREHLCLNMSMCKGSGGVDDSYLLPWRKSMVHIQCSSSMYSC